MEWGTHDWLLVVWLKPLVTLHALLQGYVVMLAGGRSTAPSPLHDCLGGLRRTLVAALLPGVPLRACEALSPTSGRGRETALRCACQRNSLLGTSNRAPTAHYRRPPRNCRHALAANCPKPPAADVDIAYTAKPLWESYMAFIEEGSADGAFQYESPGGWRTCLGAASVRGPTESRSM